MAAYQFFTRPFTLSLRLRRIEPVVRASDRVAIRLEESRLLVRHAPTLVVEKAGIYLPGARTALWIPGGGRSRRRC